MIRSAPRAAYVHIPFCRHHCGYCNFTVIAGRDELIDRYLDAIELELRATAESLELGQFEVDTLYVGGGTPTRLNPQQLGRLCAILQQWFPRSANYEFTIEANPGDLDPERIDVLVAGGVNRISLGVQSFCDDKLRALDRDHSASDNWRAIELLQSAPLQLSVDLIFAAPHETERQWEQELAVTIEMRPDHISTYGLTFERGTTFWSHLQKSLLQESPDDLQRSMYLAAIHRLADAGLVHYEVSNFALSGCRSRHNETYWCGGRYFGIGAGASRFVGNERATNHRSTTSYMKRMLAGVDPTTERETLDAEMQTRERVVFGLRRREGIDIDQITEATGVSVAELVGPSLQRFVAWGCLEQNGSRYWLTEHGLLISDSLWPELL